MDQLLLNMKRAEEELSLLQAKLEYVKDMDGVTHAAVCLSHGQCHTCSCVVVTWAVLHMQTRECHEGGVTHAVVCLSHGQCHTCSCVVVTWAVLHMHPCGCHMTAFTHAPMWLSHDRFHTCTHVVVT